MQYEKAVKFSRQRYSKPRESVEQKIARWSRPEFDKRKKQGEGEEIKVEAAKIVKKDGGKKEEKVKEKK